MTTAIFEERESNVRSYCRSFPELFCSAKGSIIYSDTGKEYIDFLAGAGALNYGHNNDYIKQRLIDYIQADGISHALDMYTGAKAEFIEKFTETILAPKNLDYKIQFCGPTGTNAVEAALKLARKLKKRPNVFSFMGSYHGMSAGSLSVTSNVQIRAGAGVALGNVTFIPYPCGRMASFDTIEYMEMVLTDTHSGIEKPAAIIFETVQAEGGVVVAPVEWMQELRKLCDRHDILLICDDIQAGCCRTGPFFSFEWANIVPDIVTLSKSISGYGLPMSLVLMKPELDAWYPGEHNGTFRGNQLAFVGASAAIELVRQQHIEDEVRIKGEFIKDFWLRNIAPICDKLELRGIGMMWGIDLAQFGDMNCAGRVKANCFKNGLIAETVGRNDTVVKIIPPLTIEMELLEQGLTILKQALIDA